MTYEPCATFLMREQKEQEYPLAIKNWGSGILFVVSEVIRGSLGGVSFRNK